MKTECCWRSYMNCDILMIGKSEYKNCPCNSCIVKPMCSSMCEKFNDFYKSIFNFNHEEYKII